VVGLRPLLADGLPHQEWPETCWPPPSTPVATAHPTHSRLWRPTAQRSRPSRCGGTPCGSTPTGWWPALYARMVSTAAADNLELDTLAMADGDPTSTTTHSTRPNPRASRHAVSGSGSYTTSLDSSLCWWTSRSASAGIIDGYGSPPHVMLGPRTVAAPSGCRWRHRRAAGGQLPPSTPGLSTASAHRRRVLKASLSNSRATTEATAVETARLHLRQDCGACSTRSLPKSRPTDQDATPAASTQNAASQSHQLVVCPLRSGQDGGRWPAVGTHRRPRPLICRYQRWRWITCRSAHGGWAQPQGCHQTASVRNGYITCWHPTTPSSRGDIGDLQAGFVADDRQLVSPEDHRLRLTNHLSTRA
jgi:hypothetical protein